MSYDSRSIYLVACNVEKNVQKVNVNCNCHQKFDDLKREADVINDLLQENRKMMRLLMKLILKKEPASIFASLDSASESASVGGKTLKISPKTNL